MSETKLCRSCGETKAVTEFQKATRRKDGLQPYCRACHAQRYQENRERLLQAARKRYRANPQPHKDRAKDWAHANPERRREIIASYSRRHVEQLTAKGREWREKHPEMVREKERRRREHIRQLGTRITKKDREERASMFGHRCYICGESCTGMDHVKPLNAGGLHVPANLRPCCSRCNSRKGTQWPFPVPQQMTPRRRLP